MDLLQEIDKIRTRAVQDVSYDFAAGRDQGVVEARTVVEKAAERVRELEDLLSHTIEFTWPTPKGTIELRHEKPFDPDATYGPWWLNVPWKPLNSGRMENFHDQAEAIARARALTSEEA